jgi:hypothetical protein
MVTADLDIEKLLHERAHSARREFRKWDSGRA